jgi:hypothetical protein
MMLQQNKITMIITVSIKPHIEYIFNWGNQNEQFLINGITLEFEGNKKRHRPVL